MDNFWILLILRLNCKSKKSLANDVDNKLGAEWMDSGERLKVEDTHMMKKDLSVHSIFV